MRPRLIDAKAPSCPWPMCDITTGRRDGVLVDFGEPAPVVTNATAKDPRALIKATRVQLAAETKLGMVSQKKLAEVEAELEEANAEAGRLRAIVAGKQGLSTAEDKLREALGPAPDPKGS